MQSLNAAESVENLGWSQGCLREQLIQAEFPGSIMPCASSSSGWADFSSFSGAKCSLKSFDREEAGCDGAPTRQLLHSQL